MSKRQVLGAVALFGAVTIPLNYNIFINCGQVAAENIFATEKQSLEASVERASDVLEQAREAESQKTVESQTYPGLADYIDRLIKDVSDYDKYQNTGDVIDALDEASEAIPYLLGLNRTQTVGVERKETVAVRSAERGAEVASSEKVIAKENPGASKSQVAQTNVRVEVRNEDVQSIAKSADEKNGVVTTAQGEVENVETHPEVKQIDDTLELPNTGATEEKKMSFAGLIIAGATVVVATIAGAVAIVLSKRKR